MNQDLLTKILDADISRETKERILSYWLLPAGIGSSGPPPIQTTEGKSGAVHRPTKEQLDLKANPKKAEGVKEMEDTLAEVVDDG